MKKIILILLLLFTANTCSAQKNSACISETQAIIFQVLDEGALAHICPRFDFQYDKLIDSCRYNGTLVYITHNDNYVDNQLVKLHKNQCFASGGAYRYQNKNGDIKTIREISIINKND